MKQPNQKIKMHGNCKSNVCDSASVERWKHRIKFWITIGSIIFKVHRFDRAQTHALMCVTLSFFSLLLLYSTCAYVPHLHVIYSVRWQIKFMNKKKAFFFLQTYTKFFPFMHWVHINCDEKKRFFVRALSLLFPGIFAFGSLVYVIFF